jgi:HicB_like antitoxin of bacterial toxin-antitoxin system
LVIFDQAIKEAGEALALHVEGMVEDGQALPAPTPLNKIEIEPDVDMHAIIPIEAHQPARKMRINVMMDVALLAEIDRVAPNRSLFLSNAARDALRAG